MYVTIGIHYPKPGKESILLEGMRKFGEAQRKHKGLMMVTGLKDETKGAIIGLAIWDSKENFLAAREDIMKSIADMDFEDLLSSPIEVYFSEPAIWV